MLGKLIKYHFKSVSEYFLPIFVGIGGFSILYFILGLLNGPNMDNVIFGENGNGVLGIVYILSTVAFFFVIVALALGSSIIMVYHFYRKYVSVEAYLTLTLPAKPWQHVFSMMVVGAIWKLLSMVVCLSAVFLVGFSFVGVSGLRDIFREIFGGAVSFDYLFNSIVSEMGLDFTTAVLTFLDILISLFSTNLICFAALSLGQMSKSHKVMMAVLWFIAMNMIVSTLTDSLTIFSDAQSFNGIFLMGIAINLVTSVVYFVITNWVLEKKVNLE